MQESKPEVTKVVSRVKMLEYLSNVSRFCSFVLRFLRPSQLSWVMSSAVNLLNHTFTGQA